MRSNWVLCALGSLYAAVVSLTQNAILVKGPFTAGAGRFDPRSDMNHKISPNDELFRIACEAFEITPDAFDHRAHVRLAYVYLCDRTPADAKLAMKGALLAFLNHLGVGKSRFHETITSAWIDAVNHFMKTSRAANSFNEFIDANPGLLNTEIMLTHYSAELLFSDAARDRVVDPDISGIPRYK